MDPGVTGWLAGETAELAERLTKKARAASLIGEDEQVSVLLEVVDPSVAIPRLTLVREISKANYVPLHPAWLSLAERKEVERIMLNPVYAGALHTLIEERHNYPSPATDLTLANERKTRLGINRLFAGSRSPALHNLRLLRSVDRQWQVWSIRQKP